VLPVASPNNPVSEVTNDPVPRTPSSAGPLYPLVVYGAAFMWVVVLLGLGFAGRSGHRWAFLAGMILYGADMIALLVTFSIWAFAVHAVLIFKWFQGQKALKDLSEAAIPAI
jgi:hypothetical protein